MQNTLTGAHLIAGQDSHAGGEAFYSFNPRTGMQGDLRFLNATPGEIDQAVSAAHEAYGVLRGAPAEKIAALLDAIADETEAIGDLLLTTADDETGLGLPRLTGERGRTTGQLRKFAAFIRDGWYVEAIIDRAQPDRQPAPRPSIRRMQFPLGAVAVFAASNFPFAFSVAGGDTAAALAAGCPVILKAHPGHPATSEFVGRAINRAVAAQGLPAGTFSMIQGNQAAVGQALVTHSGVSAVGFTGSLRAGRAIFDAAAARPTPIPVYAEMGSVNPFVVLPGALAARRDALAQGLASSVTLGEGQFCTNPGLVFLIDSTDSQQFIAEVTAKMSAIQPSVLLNPQIQQGLARAVEATLSRPQVSKLSGGSTLSAPVCGYEHTVLQTDSRAFRDDSALQSEHFGPVTLFVVCESFDDLRATLATLDGNLTTTLHGEADDAEAAGVLYDLLREKAGRLIWNGFPTGVEVVYAMQHGGPYPATSAPATTSVGMMAIKRFMRPVAFQNLPDALLPPALQDANPLSIWRCVDEQWTKDSLA